MTLRSRSWVIGFNRCSGIAQVRRATLSCDSSYCDFLVSVIFVVYFQNWLNTYEHFHTKGYEKWDKSSKNKNLFAVVKHVLKCCAMFIYCSRVGKKIMED